MAVTNELKCCGNKETDTVVNYTRPAQFHHFEVFERSEKNFETFLTCTDLM